MIAVNAPNVLQVAVTPAWLGVNTLVIANCVSFDCILDDPAVAWSVRYRPYTTGGGGPWVQWDQAAGQGYYRGAMDPTVPWEFDFMCAVGAHNVQFAF